MKIAGLIIGIVLMVLSAIVFLICLALPSMTNNRIDFGETMLGLIPSAFIFLLAAALAIISLIFVLKAKKNAPQINVQR